MHEHPAGGIPLTVAAKTTLTTLVVVLASVTIAGVLLVRGIWSLAQAQARDEAILLGRTLAQSFALPLARGEHEAIQRQVDQIAESQDQFRDVLKVAVGDERGHVVAHTDPTKFGSPWEGVLPLAEEVVVNSTGPRPEVTIRMPIATAVRFGSLELEVALRGPLELAREASSEVILALAGMTLLLVGALSLLLRRALVKPLERLAQAVNRFHVGDRNLGVPVDGPDEIRSLFRAFDGMALRLHGHTTELEKKVAERTRELSEANSQMQRVNAQLHVVNRQLQELAITDGLTGVANRRAFTDRLAIETERSRRTKRPLSLIIFDLDHFKRLNDTLGHLEGDAALIKLATVLTDSRRSTDLVARYGGEEFTLLLPDTPYEDAMVVAEKLRAAVEAAEMPGRCTASAGVATLVGEISDARSLIAAADQALYRAKAAGRNRIAGAGGPVDSVPAATGTGA